MPPKASGPLIKGHLTKQKWEEFEREARLYAKSNEIYHYIDPQAVNSRPTAPIKPSIGSVSATATRYAALPPDEREIYEFLQRQYARDMDAYRFDRDAYNSLTAKIFECLHPAHRMMIGEEMDISKIFTILAAQLKPSSAEKYEAASKELERLQVTPRVT